MQTSRIADGPHGVARVAVQLLCMRAGVGERAQLKFRAEGLGPDDLGPIAR